jgi:hypothetical protein
MTDILKNTRTELSPRPGGMSFDDGFEKPAPISPTTAKWIKAFEDNVMAVLRVRNARRAEAEGIAFLNTVTAFLDANRPDTEPTKCAQCGSSERPKDLRPMGGGTRHSWVHGDCSEVWRERRKAQATAALATMGIAPP